MQAASPVIVSPAVAMEDGVELQAVGSALAVRSVTVFPAVTGEVIRVAFSAGQRVRPGDLLVQLQDRNERLAVDRAEAQRAAAERLLQRYQETRASGAVPAAVVDEARLALRSADIALSQAREALRERSVRAPFAGVVGIAQVEQGDRVTPATPLTTLDDRNRLHVTFEVPEPFLGRLQRGQTVGLATVAYPGRRFDGRIAQIDSRVDRATRTITARAVVSNPEDALRPGMSFAVRVSLPGPSVLRVPELALQWGREGSHVWVVREGAAQRVEARVVRRIEGAVLIEGELKAGEAVVVEGFHRLRPGRPVRIVQERPADGV